MNYNQLTKKKAGRVIGIDCSTQSLAYAVFEDGELSEWGEYDFKGANTFERLADGQRKLAAVKETFVADMIVMESAIYVQNKKTVILLAYAFGAILSAILSKDCKVNELSPMQWQNAIGNKALSKVEKQSIMEQYPDKSTTWYSAKYREFRKSRTIKWVQDTFGVTVASDNVSDAIAIGHVGVVTFTS